MNVHHAQPVSDASMAETYLMAVNAVLVYFKIFKRVPLCPRPPSTRLCSRVLCPGRYIGDLPFISTLLTTLAKARGDLLVFTFVFGVIMLGFCTAFYIGLGTDLYDFRAVCTSATPLVSRGPAPSRQFLCARCCRFTLLSSRSSAF